MPLVAGLYHGLYAGSLSLLTDLYELTMAAGYWEEGRAREEAVFQLFFRRHPFGGGFTLACGLQPALDLLEGFGLDASDRRYLAGLENDRGDPLFRPEFLEELGKLQLQLDVDAVAEGTPMFPHEPMLRVRGPLLQCQIVESALLNLLNFQSLIATKAARVCLAAAGDPVLDFGLRRAQGPDGSLSAARAAYVGGCTGTSNVLAGKLLGIPVKGTHAHSWIMSFDAEADAFEAYARAMPDNCIFLVDTYDSLTGVANAIDVGRRLRERGHELLGIRLDSGDLVSLSQRARRMLDAEGFPEAKIVGSGDLDEHRIADLKRRGAQIDMWGVGTRLVTGFDDPALTGVYKIAAIRDGAVWKPRIKLSEQPGKTTTPGILQVRRFFHEGQAVGDVIYDAELGPGSGPPMLGREEQAEPLELPVGAAGSDLLRPALRGGRRVGESPSLEELRGHARRQLELLPPALRALDEPADYPVGLEASLLDRKRRLIAELQRKLAGEREARAALRGDASDPAKEESP